MLRKLWRRTVFTGFLAGSLLCLQAGCDHAAVQGQRKLEEKRAKDPDARYCGMYPFSLLAVGILWAIPGGLLGAAIPYYFGRAAGFRSFEM